MTLDSEEDREIILELIQKAHFPGAHARKVVSLLDRIEKAGVQAEPVKVIESPVSL